jgi:rod shape-determining protein MreC
MAMVQLPRKFRDIALCVTLLAVPVLFLHSNLKTPAEMNPLDRALLRISAPVQAAITAVVSGIHRGWKRYVYLVGVERDNERLRKENATQRAELRDAQRRLGRMRSYERLLGFRATRGVETIGVRVIGRDASPFVRVVRVRVDRGAPHLRPNLPVVTADGVVGKVARSYGSYSDVLLAVDPKSNIDVVIQRTGARGLLRGIDGTNRYLCRIEYLLQKEEVKVGDLVVTSGVEGVFPKDLPVGRISKVNKRSYNLYQELEVIPAVDFSTVDEMLVILAPPPPPVATEERGAEPARGLLP